MKNTIVFLLLIYFIFPVTAQQPPNSRFVGYLFSSPVAEKADITVNKINGNIEYEITPGDNYQLYLHVRVPGNEAGNQISLVATLTGKYELELPYLGTVTLKPMLFSVLRDQIITKYKNYLPTLYLVDFKLVSPAIFEVFVYGKVKTSGFFDLSALERVTSAIALAKGLLPDGSYRNVELIRNNQTTKLDFLKYLESGDTKQNPVLKPGDKIHILPAEILCRITGKVAYPDIYELQPGETLRDLLHMAGEILPDGAETAITVTRFQSGTFPASFLLSLDKAAGFTLADGDTVEVAPVLKNEATVLLEGALYAAPSDGMTPLKIPAAPVVFSIPFRPGMTLLQLLDEFGGPTPYADAANSVINRKTGEKIPVDVSLLWETKDSRQDRELAAGDHVLIPMQNLVVVVAGNVNRPGSFAYRTESRVGDYILLAGGINPDTGSQWAIYKIDTAGNRTRLTLDDYVRPGTLIYVDKSGWNRTQYTIGQMQTIIGVSAAIVGLAASIINLIITSRDL